MINVIKHEDLPLPKLNYYLATYKKYEYPTPENVLEDNITNKELLDINEENSVEDLRKVISQLVLFNQENKSTILQGSLGNYYIQQKIINE